MNKTLLFLVFCTVLAAVVAHSKKPRCLCPKIHHPVCGTDNVTYGNKCQLNCARKHNRNKADLAVLREGKCGISHYSADGSPPERCLCTKEYVPVCASNGKTYSNRCEFGCAKKLKNELAVVREGSCELVD